MGSFSTVLNVAIVRGLSVQVQSAPLFLYNSKCVNVCCAPEKLGHSSNIYGTMFGDRLASRCADEGQILDRAHMGM